MKEQGDVLLRQGNFEGAVNAYDRALDLDGSLTPVLGNRAICKLKLKQFRCARHCRSYRSWRAARLSEAVCQVGAWGKLRQRCCTVQAAANLTLHPILASPVVWVELMQRCMVFKAAAAPLLQLPASAARTRLKRSCMTVKGSCRLPSSALPLSQLQPKPQIALCHGPHLPSVFIDLCPMFQGVRGGLHQCSGAATGSQQANGGL